MSESGFLQLMYPHSIYSPDQVAFQKSFGPNVVVQDHGICKRDFLRNHDGYDSEPVALRLLHKFYFPTDTKIA